MSTTKDRAFTAVNLAQFNDANFPDEHSLNGANITPPQQQRLLRMLIREPFCQFKIPHELEWAKTMIDLAYILQEDKGIRQPYCYVTVRCGSDNPDGEDSWHTDGFSVNITHLPEQNYVWSSNHGTLIAVKPIKIPSDFSPFRHNIHIYLNEKIESEGAYVLSSNPSNLYCIDPYVIHKRPTIPVGTYRAFIRIDFSPIMIVDDLNTQNPLLPVKKFNREGVRDFRNKLIRYRASDGS